MHRSPLAALLLPLLAACAPDLSELGPLAGTWATEDPRFRACAITFAPDGVLLLGRSEGPAQICQVQNIEVEREQEQLCYRVDYQQQDGVQAQLQLVLSDGQMHLRNQREVTWRKRSSQP